MRNTQLARIAMRKSNALQYPNLYTNKHEKCRTVKGYVHNDYGEDAVEFVQEELRQMGVDATVKFIPSTLGYGYIHTSQTGSLIVRVPKDY